MNPTQNRRRAVLCWTYMYKYVIVVSEHRKDFLRMNTERFTLEELTLDKIAAISVGDLQALNELLGTRFSKKGWSTSPEKLSECLAHGGIVCVARDVEAELKIVGTVTLAPCYEVVGASWGLGYVCVAEHLERRGITTAIILRLHELARALGIKSIKLGVRDNNEGAIALYEKIGYKRRGGYKYRIEL